MRRDRRRREKELGRNLPSSLLVISFHNIFGASSTLINFLRLILFLPIFDLKVIDFVFVLIPKFTGLDDQLMRYSG